MTAEQVLEVSPVSVRDLIRERLELSEDPNPRSIVDELLEDLPEDLAQHLLRQALGLLAVAVSRDDRQRTYANGKPTASAKWDQVAQAVKDRPDIFAVRVFIGEGVFKFLGDCTAENLLAAAELDRDKGEGLIRRADQYAHLSRLITENDKRHVKGLGVRAVEEVFDA